jgi:DNA polymerase III delta prime subunit
LKVTLEVLCKEKNIDIIQWNQPNTILQKIGNDEADNEDHYQWQNNVQYESQTKLFNNFLYKSSRYVSDQIFMVNESNIRNKKILFIKDIPLFAFRDIKSFQSLLKNFLKYSKSSLIFSLTNSPSMSNEFNASKIFKQEFRKELAILEVTFNPIASSYLLKHLERIVKLENLSSLIDKDSLNEICAACDGDLRQAMNILELSINNPRVKSLSQLKSSVMSTENLAKKKKTTTASLNSNKSKTKKVNIF